MRFAQRYARLFRVDPLDVASRPLADMGLMTLLYESACVDIDAAIAKSKGGE